MSKTNGAINLLKKIDKKDFKISFALKRDMQNLIIKRNNLLNNIASLERAKQATMLSVLSTEDLQELDKLDEPINELKKALKEAKNKYQEALMDSKHKENSKAINTVKALEGEINNLLSAKQTKMGFIVASKNGLDKSVNTERDQQMEQFFEEKTNLDFEIFEKLTDYFGLSETIKNTFSPIEIEELIEAVVQEPSNYFIKSFSDLFTRPSLANPI